LGPPFLFGAGAESMRAAMLVAVVLVCAACSGPAPGSADASVVPADAATGAPDASAVAYLP